MGDGHETLAVRSLGATVAAIAGVAGRLGSASRAGGDRGAGDRRSLIERRAGIAGIQAVNSGEPHERKRPRQARPHRRRCPSRRREARTGHREQALKIYPWICGRCAREFTRANLRELTVHHRDHDHDNNPPDGSNWELLLSVLPRQRTPAAPEASGRKQQPFPRGRASTYAPFAKSQGACWRRNHRSEADSGIAWHFGRRV